VYNKCENEEDNQHEEARQVDPDQVLQPAGECRHGVAHLIEGGAAGVDEGPLGDDHGADARHVEQQLENGVLSEHFLGEEAQQHA